MPTKLSRNLSRERYLSYLKLLPDLRKQKTRDYTMLALTFFAMTFFGIFAINPTFSTITRLRRELDDSKFVEQQLQKKLDSLSSLLQQQSVISNDLPTIYAAVPEKPEAPKLLGQLQSLAKKNNLSVSGLQAYEVQLSGVKETEEKTTIPTFEFSISVTGDSDRFMQLVTDVSSFDRLLTVTNISYEIDEEVGEELTIQGKAYYMHNEK